MKELSYEEITFSTKYFSLDRLIGKGSHGSVYRGILKGDHGKKEVVAVKKPSDASKLDKEIEILSSINQSPYLVNLIGICHGPTHKLLVTEFMPNGSLHDLLHSSPNPPAWPRRMLMALQVARAVLSLHEAHPQIIHRDIKSANILLDRRWNARLADFSLAVRARDSAVPPAGTLGYLDPEYTAAEKLGPENDVFSFGVLLLELVSSRKVMDMDSDPASIVSWAVPMIREKRVADVCDERVVVVSGEMLRLVGRVLGVAARCVSREEGRRPTMVEVVGELRGVLLHCVSWPSWSYLKSKISLRVYRCARAWRRRCKKKRVTTAATRKMINNHEEDEI